MPLPAPDRTLALVVALERYDLGPDWTLDSPAHGALAFVGWLRSLGVPPANIHLHLAERDPTAHATEWTSLQVQPQPATRAALRNALTAALPKRDSDLLYVLWIGHGVMVGKEQRRLFYAEATPSDLQNLDVESMLAYLRSVTYAAHPRQLVLIESCANFHQDLRRKVGLPDDSFFTAGQEETIEQDVLFASASGQRATASLLRPTGRFSEAILDELKRQSAQGNVPDVDALLARVKAHFTELENAGETRQTPVHFQWRGRVGGGGRWGDALGVAPASLTLQQAAQKANLSVEQLYGLAEAALACPTFATPAGRDALVNALPQAARDALDSRDDDAFQDALALLAACCRAAVLPVFAEQLLARERQSFPSLTVQDRIQRLQTAGEAYAIASQLAVAYRDLRRDYARSVRDYRAAPPARLDAMLTELAQLRPLPNRAAPLDEFMARLHLRLNETDAPLALWLARRIPSLPDRLQLLDFLRQEQASQRAYHLLIDIALRTGSREPRDLEAWLWAEPGGPIGEPMKRSVASLQEAQTELTGLIEEALGQIPGDTPSLLVELLLPRELLCLQVELWPLDQGFGQEAALADLYPVVLRWRERLAAHEAQRPDRNHQLRLNWRATSDRIRQRLDRGDPPRSHWLAAPLPYAEVVRLLQATDCAECLGLEYVPDRVPNPKSDALSALLVGGVPYLWWPRENPNDAVTLRQCADDLLTKGDFDALPQRWLQGRYHSACPGPTHAVVLLWDHPGRTPHRGEKLSVHTRPDP